jgi:AAA ATPase-like protein
VQWGLGWMAPVALPRAFSPTIRGRDAELEVLGEQLDRVRSGSGAVLLIEGAAGMGKSRLIGEGVRMAHRLSLPVGIAAAEPSESVAELRLCSGRSSTCSLCWSAPQWTARYSYSWMTCSGRTVGP